MAKPGAATVTNSKVTGSTCCSVSNTALDAFLTLNGCTVVLETMAGFSSQIHVYARTAATSRNWTLVGEYAGSVYVDDPLCKVGGSKNPTISNDRKLLIERRKLFQLNPKTGKELSVTTFESTLRHGEVFNGKSAPSKVAIQEKDKIKFI